MQRVKDPDRFDSRTNFDPQTSLRRFPDATAHGPVQTLKKRIRFGLEPNHVAIESQRRNRTRMIGNEPTALQVTPPAVPTMRQDGIIKGRTCAVTPAKRHATVGKRERDTAQSRPAAGDLHDGQKVGQLTRRKPAIIGWLVSIGVMEHTRPRRPVKERAFRVRRQQGIPCGTLQGINRNQLARPVHDRWSLGLSSHNFKPGIPAACPR
jgi:hypothetical protein